MFLVEWDELKATDPDAYAYLLSDEGGMTLDDALLDIGFDDADGNEIEPDLPITVGIESRKVEIAEVYHVEDAETVTLVAEDAEAAAEFVVESCSVYALRRAGSALRLDAAALEVEAGTRHQLYVYDGADEVTGKAVTWESSNTDVATVEDGLVKALAAGTTTITATVEGEETPLTCAITVTGALSSKAYAIYDSDKATLVFYHDVWEPAAGDTVTVKVDETETAYTVSNVYTDIEADNGGSPWAVWGILSLLDDDDGIASATKKVVFADTIKPVSTAHWFGGFRNLTTIEGLEKLDTSEVTDMSGMFSGCEALETLDLSSFDTSNVTDMSYMFENCSALTSLDLSGLNTSNVKNMSYMFGGCSALTALDLSKFDTAKVTDMSGMFYGCDSLTTLDLSKFDTSNVTDMSCMFMTPGHTVPQSSGGGIILLAMSGWFNLRDYNQLTELNLSSFDTAKVTDMSNMFSGCWKLTALDLSKFDTSKVTDMSDMFENCQALTALDLSKFDTSKVTDMGGMFYNCKTLASLDLSKFDTSKVAGMNSMFYGCSSLKALDLRNFDTSNAWDLNYMFHECAALESVDVSSFNTTEVTWMQDMFRGCAALKTLDLSNFYVGADTEMIEMLKGVSDDLKLTVSTQNKERLLGDGSDTQCPSQVASSATVSPALTVTLSPATFTHDGAAHTVSVASVTYGDATLTEGTDYTVSGTLSAADPGEYAVTVTGQGSYAGKVTKATWMIDYPTGTYVAVVTDGANVTYCATYDALRTALESVHAGATVTLRPTGGYKFVVTGDLTIPEGVTLAMPENFGILTLLGDGSIIFEADASGKTPTLTVNGKLSSEYGSLVPFKDSDACGLNVVIGAGAVIGCDLKLNTEGSAAVTVGANATAGDITVNPAPSSDVTVTIDVGTGAKTGDILVTPSSGGGVLSILQSVGSGSKIGGGMIIGGGSSDTTDVTANVTVNVASGATTGSISVERNSGGSSSPLLLLQGLSGSISGGGSSAIVNATVNVSAGATTGVINAQSDGDGTVAVNASGVKSEYITAQSNTATVSAGVGSTICVPSGYATTINGVVVDAKASEYDIIVVVTEDGLKGSVDGQTPKNEVLISSGTLYVDENNVIHAGTPVTETTRDAEGNLVKTTTEVYDEGGNLVKTTIVVEPGKEITLPDGKHVTGPVTVVTPGDVTVGNGGVYDGTAYPDGATIHANGEVHAWGAPAYEWSDDNRTVTATRVCTGGEVETETVKASVEITSATYDEAGSIVYTATFKSEAFATQTKTVEIERLTRPSTPPVDDSGGNAYYDDSGGSDYGGTTSIIDEDVPLSDGMEIIDGDVPLAQLPMAFADVALGDWFYDAVYHVWNAGIMQGDGMFFLPYDATIRAQIALTLMRMSGDGDTATGYDEAMAWANEKGVLIGDENGELHPGDDVTRQELVTILYRYAALQGYGMSERADLSGFDDAGDISEYARDAFAWAVSVGLIKGDGEGLNPTGEATRAEIATVLMRFAALGE